jgi:Tfp pilus assembly protein PilV
MPPVPAIRRVQGFTLIEVMMAAVMLVVAFIGMIQAITIGSEMQATARRQTLAAQIINHEIEKLRYATWTTISALPVASTAITIDTQFTTAVAASGATFSLARTLTNPDPYTNIREVNFTVTWIVQPSGLTVSRTYTRTNSAWYGKYGLNLTYQRS